MNKEYDLIALLRDWLALSVQLRSIDEISTDIGVLTERQVDALQARSRIALGMTQQYSGYRNPDREKEENA